MKITFRDGIFVAVAELDERDALQKAGFSFHRGLDLCKAGPATCIACRKGFRRGWWTRRPEAAVRLSAYGDHHVQTALAPHVKAVEMSRATSSDADIPCPKGLTYYPYQKAGIVYMSLRESTLLGDDMGLGKTAQTIGIINFEPSIRNVLVICPASLRINWYREARRWLIQDFRHWNYHIVDEDEPIPDSINFVIVNYNRVTIGFSKCSGHCGGQRRKGIICPTCKGTGDGAKHPDICGTCSGKKTVWCPECRGRGKIAKKNLKIVESLMSREWDLLVADESQFIKNLRAARTRAIIGTPGKTNSGLIGTAKKKLFLTGTPLPNRPIEMWPIISVCAPAAFGSFQQFARRYCGAHQQTVPNSTKTIWKVDGASNLEELQERLRSTCLLRRLKKDVLTDLPPKMRQIVPLVPSDEARKIITQELNEWESKFGGEFDLIQETLYEASQNNDTTSAAYKSAVDRLQYIQRVGFMEMSATRKLVALAKLPSVISHIEDMYNEGVNKIVCFAHHKEVIESLSAHFGSKSVKLYGATKGGSKPNDPKNERQQAIDRFQNDPNVKLFIGGILAAGTGITLTAASYMVFAELDWTPSNVTQCEDRIYRIGQRNPVLIQHLVLDGSLDARMAQLIKEKQEIADRALDNCTDVAVKGIVGVRPESAVDPIARWKKIMLKEAMVTLAQPRDPLVESSHGFSEFDATLGLKFASMRFDLSDRQAHIAIKFAKKYRAQLDEEIQKQLGVYEAPTPAELRRQRSQYAGKKQPVVVLQQSLMDYVERKARAL